MASPLVRTRENSPASMSEGLPDLNGLKISLEDDERSQDGVSKLPNARNTAKMHYTDTCTAQPCL